jgi:hypothetical protein
MKLFVLALLLVASCSCGALSSAATTSPSVAASPFATRPSHSDSPQPLPSPLTSAFLAIVAGPDNTINLLGSDGSAIATATVAPKPFVAHIYMSWTSATLSRVYYLNAGSEVRYLSPDGSSGTVTQIKLATGEQAGFAVSPDDTRIAISIFSYTPPLANPNGFAGLPTYNGMRLYVEDLHGGGHHVDIFSSKTVAEFPIGWSSGRLILAVGQPLCCQALPLNPYAASSYHVVDPATGNRLASLCDGSDGPEGPIEPAGAICYHNGAGPTFENWDGKPFPAPAAVPESQYLVALAPDGSRAAVGGAPIQIWGPNGSNSPQVVSGYVFGWLDATHVVFQTQTNPTLSILDLTTSTSSRLLAQAIYQGTLPAPVK